MDVNAGLESKPVWSFTEDVQMTTHEEEMNLLNQNIKVEFLIANHTRLKPVTL